MLSAYANAPSPVTLYRPTGQWGAPEQLSRLDDLVQTHTAVPHVYARTPPPLNIIYKAVPFPIQVFAQLSILGQRAFVTLGTTTSRSKFTWRLDI